MPTSLVKHREAQDVYAVDFAADLEEGETLTSPSVRVERFTSGESWADATLEFLAEGEVPQVEGSQVRVWLKAAGAGEQMGHTYRLVAKAVGEDGRILPGVAPLRVDE